MSERVEERVRDWGVAVQDTLETESSFITFGNRGNQPVILKVARQPGDEWRCGAVMAAFDGWGMARVYEYVGGAALLERLNPGTQLASVVLDGRDEEATEILADVIDRMSRPCESSDEPSCDALKAFASAQDWGKGIRRYLASGDRQIGASLRNPYEKPELFASAETVERRLRCFEAKLKLNSDRALAWGFAQAVLSAIWSVEDGFAVDAGNPSLRLAKAISPILK